MNAQMDRQSELDAFKALNLSVVACAFGYAIDRKKSTRHSVLMSNGSDKIIVSQNGQHYIYCSVYAADSNGTVIDFAQKVIEPGCSLGRVRQLLRPFLDGGHLAQVQKRYVGRFAAEIKPSETDLGAVAARFSRFVPITEPHPYLCQVRGIPFDLLQSSRLAGRVLRCPKTEAIIFPHWGWPSATESSDRCLVGYEIKGPSINMFSKAGRKGLWISAGKKTDRKLAFCESGLDAISYLAIRDFEGLRVASISGQMNSQQPALIRAAIEHMGQGAQIIAAFDNDRGGDTLTEQLYEITRSAVQDSISFEANRPRCRGQDWNQVLLEQAPLSDDRCMQSSSNAT